MKNRLSLGMYVQANDCLPTIDSLKKFIDIIAKLGYKRLTLGIGENFFVEKQPYLAYMKGRYKTVDVREMDTYAKNAGIELIPAIQTLAHFHSIPCYAHYKPMFDHSHVLLADDEKTYSFLRDIFEAVSSAFSSRRIMIGMDEAHMLGAGRYYDLHGYADRTELFLRHLKRVLAIASEFGYACSMWSDMFFKLQSMENYAENKMFAPEKVLGELPENLKIVHWNYAKVSEEEHRRVLKEHKKLSQNVSVTGGCYQWVGFAPNNTYSIEANRALIAAAQKEGISEIDFSMWNDNGGEAGLFAVLPAIFDAAVTAGTIGTEEAAEYFKRLTGLTYGEFLTADYLNYPYFQKIELVANCSFYYLYADPLLATFHSMITENISEAFGKYAEKVKPLQKGAFGYLFETYYALARVLENKARLGVEIKNAYRAHDVSKLKDIAENTIPETVSWLEEFFKAFERQWHKENSSIGFEIHCARIGTVKFRLEYVQKVLERYLCGETKKIDELEEETLDFCFEAGAKEDTYTLMCWNNIITHGINW